MAAKEEKKRLIRRLETMRPLRAKVNQSYLDSLQAMQAGKPTVWSMVNFWLADTIFKTIDIEVVYPENYGTVVAGSGMAQSYLDASDAAGFPTHLCGYSRVTLGYTKKMMEELGGQIPPDAPMGGMPKPVLLLARVYACDVGLKWFQALGRYMDVPVWALEYPSPGVKEFFAEGYYEGTISFMVQHLREFIAFLERLLGRKMDWDKLSETVDLVIELNRVWHEVNLLRKARPGPMHCRDFYSSMPPSLFLAGDLRDSTKCYQDMYKEVKDRVDNHIAAIVTEEKYRLMFAELPPWHSLGIFDALAERGWNFVIEGYGYHPPPPIDVSAYKDPLERLVRFALHRDFYALEGALKENVLSLAGYPYLDYVREHKVDGMLLHPLISCRTASSHIPYISNLMMERLKVPSLIVEGDIVDLRLFDPEELMRKAEPFEEAMDHYKKVRKEEGFDW